MECGAGGGYPEELAGLEEPDIRALKRHRQLTRASPEAEEAPIPQSYTTRPGGSGGLDLKRLFTAF